MVLIRNWSGADALTRSKRLRHGSIALERFLFFVRSLNPMVTRSSSISSLVKPLGAMVVVVGGAGVPRAEIEVCCGSQKCHG